jgi:hypothetical protein
MKGGWGMIDWKDSRRRTFWEWLFGGPAPPSGCVLCFYWWEHGVIVNHPNHPEYVV